MIFDFHAPGCGFLSNFYPCQVKFGKFVYSSSECAYMSAKRHDIEWKEFCESNPAKVVKARSREVKIRADWDDVKINVMREVLRIKFDIPELREKLLATGDVQLVEGNTWGDEFWGVNAVTGSGLNHLGILLMERRDIIKKEEVENKK